jgi:hypothetical protein
LFDNRGNIALSIRDLLNSERYRSQVEGSNFTAEQMFRWQEGPIFSLTFSYQLKDTDARRPEDGGAMFGGEGGGGGF